ncbi:MAG: hypothetical protein J3Q66DRAFT_136916 [Benniella sp.]|nr:MAG: hypothetical protein J3Q66DRAFT_136916 [Benniella sp.]
MKTSHKRVFAAIINSQVFSSPTTCILPPTMAKVNPLDLPEILSQVGAHITIWHQENLGIVKFRPEDMLSCIQVSRHFRDTLLPILWYTFHEEAMWQVPVDILRKYTPFFRVHERYGYRSTYPIGNREPCTRLLHLTIASGYSTLEAQDIEFIKRNTLLKSLAMKGKVQISSFYGDMFYKFKNLEHLGFHLVAVDPRRGSHAHVFHPISATLKVLHLGCERGAMGLQDVFFPNVKELVVFLSDPQDAVDLLQGCPYLESLDPIASIPRTSSSIIEALKLGVCPYLKNLGLRATMDHEKDLVEVLKGRKGLERLNIRIEKLQECLALAISCHASSLVNLSIHVEELVWLPFSLIPISCGQLKNVTIQYLGYKDMESAMKSDHWKSPEVLESINLTCDGRTQRRDELRLKRLLLEDLRAGRGYLRALRSGSNQGTSSPGSTNPENSILGWKIPSEKVGRMHDKSFLKKIFKDAEGFERLRTITVSNIVYKRIQ